MLLQNSRPKIGDIQDNFLFGCPKVLDITGFSKSSVSTLVPTNVAKKDATPETPAAASVSAVSKGKIEHQPRWRCKTPFLWCVVIQTFEQTTA